MINSSMIALIFILLVLILIVLLITHQGKPRVNKSYFLKHWQVIEAQGGVGAVIKADTLLEEALKQVNIKGNTTGERLRNASGYLKDTNGTWAAHKLRNKIVHEPDAQPSSADCQRALGQFKKALKDLGAL